MILVAGMGSKHHILVVEDDVLMQNALAISLQRAGFEVTSVATVKETAVALDNQSFAAVVTDICLPDGDGLEVFTLTGEKRPQTPVLAMTAYIDTELGKRAKRLFGERLFEKPFKKNVFIQKVKGLV